MPLFLFLKSVKAVFILPFTFYLFPFAFFLPRSFKGKKRYHLGKPVLQNLTKEF